MLTRTSMVVSIVAALSLVGCNAPKQTATDKSIPWVQVQASSQSEAVFSDDDAADDSTIWYNQDNPENSLVIGTNKRWGIEVYNLAGKRVQQLPVGRVNNVDHRANVAGHAALAAASNRTEKAISLFSIDQGGTVALTANVPTDLGDPYGLCMGKVDGAAYVFINGKQGTYQQWRVNSDTSLTKVRQWVLPAQPEGCAVDDETGTLYFGIEEMGLYKMAASESAATDWQLIDATGTGRLVADIEGIDVYRTENHQWLVTSSQGNNSYVVYQLQAPHKAVGIVRVGDGDQIDGTQETDGIAINSAAMPGFEAGIWVIQDGVNTMPAANQNFKYVSMQAVIDQLAQ